MQNSTKQDVTTPTRFSSDPLLRYSWSNSNGRAKNLELDNEPSTGNLRGWLTVFMLLTASMISSSCLADRLTPTEPYGFARVGAGFAQYKYSDGYDGLAAHFNVGIAWPVSDNVVIDARIGHGSFWFEPDDSDWVNYGNVGLEIRW